MLVDVVMECGEVGDGGGFWGAQAVVDGQRLRERGDGGRDVVFTVGAASHTGQRVCLSRRGADGAGEGVGLGEQDVWVTGWRVVQGEIAQAVECFGLPVGVADIGKRGVCLGQEIQCLVVVALLVVHAAQGEQDVGGPAPGADVDVQVVGLVERPPGSLKIFPEIARATEIEQGVGLPEPVAEVSIPLMGLVKHLLRPLKISPQVRHVAEVECGGGQAELVTEVGEQSRAWSSTCCARL